MQSITINYCSKCKRKNNGEYNEFIKKLKARYKTINTKDMCLSFCGPGSKFFFVSIGNKFIYSDNVDDIFREIDKILYNKEQ